MTATHVVIGAGPIGSAVAELLAAEGDAVKIVTRSGSGPESAGIERIAADATDADRLTRIAADAAAIYNCANPQYDQWETLWPPLHQAMMTAASRTGAVLAITSNLYGYGPVAAAMTEDLPLATTTRKGAVRARMWEQALAAHAQGHLRAVEVRSSDYVGPSSNTALQTVALPRVLAGKRAFVFGNPDQPHTFTYTLDAARTLVRAATDEHAWGRAWHTPSNPPATQRGILASLARRAGAPTPRLSRVPDWLISAGGVVVPIMGEIPEMLYQFNAPFVMDSNAAEKAFHMEPTPWPEIMDDVVQWVQQSA